MPDLREKLARVIWEEEGKPCSAAFDDEEPCYKHRLSFLGMADTILASGVIAQVRAETLREATDEFCPNVLGRALAPSSEPYNPAREAANLIKQSIFARADRIEKEAGR